jgi:hypothetical protein
MRGRRRTSLPMPMHRQATRFSHTWDRNDGKIIPVKWFHSKE